MILASIFLLCFVLLTSVATLPISMRRLHARQRRRRDAHIAEMEIDLGLREAPKPAESFRGGGYPIRVSSFAVNDQLVHKIAELRALPPDSHMKTRREELQQGGYAVPQWMQMDDSQPEGS